MYKKIFISISVISLIFLSACKRHPEKSNEFDVIERESDSKKLEDLVEHLRKDTLNKEMNSDILLGFKLGMNINDARTKVQNYMKSDKIYYCNSPSPVTGYDESHCFPNVEYKLCYQLSLGSDIIQKLETRVSFYCDNDEKLVAVIFRVLY